MLVLRLTITWMLLAVTSPAGEVRSAREAWSFLANPTEEEKGVQFSAGERSKFGYCSSADNDVTCEFPVWFNLAEKVNFSLDSPKATPHPALPDSTMRIFLTPEGVQTLKSALAGLGLKPEDVYHQAISESGEPVGTTRYLVVVLDAGYREFDKFVRACLIALGEDAPAREYRFKTVE